MNSVAQPVISHYMKKILLAIIALLTVSFGAMAITPASFPGGKAAENEYIQKNIKYPPAAMENGIEGVVGVIFVVNTDGTIGNIKIKRMIDPDLESESIRLVKNMPKWIPASDNGTPVESQAEVNVTFTLK